MPSCQSWEFIDCIVDYRIWWIILIVNLPSWKLENLLHHFSMIIILFFSSFDRINFWPFPAGLNDSYFFADDGDVFLLVMVEFNKGFTWHFIDGFGFGGIFFLGDGEDITFFFLFSCEFIKHLNYKLSIYHSFIYYNPLCTRPLHYVMCWRTAWMYEFSW